MTRTDTTLEGRPLRRSDIDDLQAALDRLQIGFSEYSVANLYLFRTVHDYRRMTADMLLLQGRTYDGQAHLLPLAALDCDDQAALVRTSGIGLYPMEAHAAAPAGLAFTSNPDDADYVFAVDDLVHLSGARRRERRRQRDHFRRRFAPRDEPIGHSHRKAAQDVLDAWLADTGQAWAATDYLACREALDLLEPLRLTGAITFTQEREAAGFLLGSRLPDGSIAIHFAKGRRSYPGVFAHMFSAFAERRAGQYPRLNFEQELGKAGFRQAKRAYGPIEIRPKCRLTLAAGRKLAA